MKPFAAACARSASRCASEPVRNSRSAPALAGSGSADAKLDTLSEQVQPAFAAVQDMCRPWEAHHSVERRRGMFARREDLDVADHVLTTAQRADRQRPGDAGGTQGSSTSSASAAARPSGIRGIRERSPGSAAAIAASIAASKPGSARSFCSRAAAPMSATEVSPSSRDMTPSCSSVTAPDSNSQRRSAGRSAIADSTRTQPPASYICRSRFRISGSVPAGGLSKSGPVSASDWMPRSRISATARVHSAASAQIAAHRRQQRELFERLMEGRRASLSTPRVRGWPAWELLWFPSGGWRRASRRCRP